jgi:uncharacterized protein (UPF0548 family)
MFLALKPSRQQILNFISAQTASNFSYAHVGASIDGKIPLGYNLDHNRIRLGAGKEIWDRGVKALRAWRMFDMPWVQLCWPDAPIEVGTNVAVLINHLGFCSLNAARIVYTIQEDGGIMRYGFAYGTLADHGESGEERFSLEWHRSDDSVWYDLLAFSRPNALLARLGYPLARMLQRSFVDGSKLAMTRAVSS